MFVLHVRMNASYLFHSVIIVSYSPSSELVFSGKDDNDVLCTLTLTNISDCTVAFKVIISIVNVSIVCFYNVHASLT